MPDLPFCVPSSSPRVGYFPSVPWIPNYTGRAAWPVELVRCESSGVRGLIEHGRLDVTPLAIPDLFELEGRWRRLANWGISYRGVAGSVLFFSPRPWHELDDCPVAICDETTTSVRVLQALMKQKYGLRIGRWTRALDPADELTPRLLIQDQAVAELRKDRFAYIYDIGHEWWGWQGTPIVSAVWAHRADLDAETVAGVESLIAASVARYRANPRAAVAARQAEQGLPAPVNSILALHRNFQYALDAEAEKGIERMRQVLEAKVDGFEHAKQAAGAEAVAG